LPISETSPAHQRKFNSDELLANTSDDVIFILTVRPPNMGELW
jgi:hypothetical protein